MIAGIGHDISDMDRIAVMIDGRHCERFLQRILTSRERELARDYEGQRLIQFAAGRFAAKEAVVKALGCGIGGKVGFADIDILRDESGKPVCELTDAAWRRLERSPTELRIHVTITHDRSMASAVAIAERIQR
ncbi:holo-ACP synthase [Paenibacillus sp. NEAU-GSW1]|uniref:holo-ACP synthase n=1 Tax=Paenibacillus sp. NEAU-GSW1 TaxID=2682486 RepID=UPI0012E17657|nr:holo-ACP synthase [Paenibacillus sp. NEAU-GSW1]MUT67770.1 holo-[acyl-carrier-protein] synthase [Paenibacillus sp. NEAU-GSW1]